MPSWALAYPYAALPSSGVKRVRVYLQAHVAHVAQARHPCQIDASCAAGSPFSLAVGDKEPYALCPMELRESQAHGQTL